MSRGLSKLRRRQLLNELRRELPHVFLIYKAQEAEHRDVIALAEALLSPDRFQEWLSARSKPGWQAATTALAKAVTDPSGEAFASWADRSLFDPGSPDALLDEEARRGLRTRLLARLRDRDRRRNVTKILLSRQMAATLNALRHDGETAREAVERLIRDAAARQDSRLDGRLRERPKEMRPMTFRAGWIYPLKVATRYDDEFGTGFDHAAVPHDATGIEQAWIVDCWIADAGGKVHPGYDANPIPVRLDDLDEDCGRPLGRPLPKPRSLFDAPFPFAR